MKVFIGGGSGFIGSAVAKRLPGAQLISREGGKGRLSWEQLLKNGLPPCDVVINLAGANVMAKRWSKKRKRLLYTSRIDTNRMLSEAIAQSENPPALFIHASAVGYYPGDGRFHTEEDPPGDSFGSKLAADWEAAAALPEGHPTRRVAFRIGLVLGEGGALAQMLPLFKLGLGGPIGKGNQGFPWIHIDDLTRMIEFIIETGAIAGPINAVAPGCVSQKEFAKSLGKQLGRPTFMPFPATMAKLLLGERAQLLLESPYVKPEVALDSGFQFDYPELEKALQCLTKGDEK
jgi:uncharacterized protein